MAMQKRRRPSRQPAALEKVRVLATLAEVLLRLAELFGVRL